MNLTIVVCGWHFKTSKLYRQLVDEVTLYNSQVIPTSQLSTMFYVASHKPISSIDATSIATITSLGWNLLHFPNEGWDWGAYQQFLLWQRQNQRILTDYYLFLHDDIHIRKHGFLAAFLERVAIGSKVIGNGTAVQKPDRVRTDYPEDVIWATLNGFPITVDSWSVVRGSCLFTIRDVAETVLLQMPIKKGKDILLANSSLRVFGGLVAQTYGPSAIDYLGHCPRTSPYLEEEYRGNQNPKPLNFHHIFAWCLDKSVIGRLFLNYLKSKRIPPPIILKGLKINLSLGEDSLPGYLNIDVRNNNLDSSQHFLDIECFPKTVSVIQLNASIITENNIDFLSLLKRSYDRLSKNGCLIIRLNSNSIFNRYTFLLTRFLSALGYPIRASEYTIKEDKHSTFFLNTHMTTNKILTLLNLVGFHKFFVQRTPALNFRKRIKIMAIK